MVVFARTFEKRFCPQRGHAKFVRDVRIWASYCSLCVILRTCMSSDMSDLRTDIPVPIGMSAMSSVACPVKDKSAAACKTGAEQVGPT
jgi:hypothetical protein